MTREGSDGERSLPMITRRSTLTATAGGLLSTSLATTPATAQQDDRLQWTFETGDSVSSSPTVVDKTVFVGSNDNNLYAVAADTGEQEWAFETFLFVYSSPTVVDGTVFVGSTDGNLYAVAADTGEQQWAFETGNSVGSSPTVVDETVCVGSNDNNLYALNAETGSQEWAFETGNSVSSSPTVVDETVFVGSDDGNLYALNAETGSQEWAFNTGNSVRSSPTVVNGTVFVGSRDNNLYALNAETGSQEWTFETGGEVSSSPTVVDGTVFVGSGDGNLYAVAAETGSQEWTFETSDLVLSSPTVVDGTVFVGCWDGELYAVDADVSGSSEGSRVLLGTEGHHDEWRYADQSITIPTSALYTSWVRNNIELLGVGGIATGVVTGSGYGAWRWWSSRQASTPTPDETAPTQADTSEQSASEGAESTESKQTGVENLREQADTALESADTARERNDYSAARDAYEEALGTYQAALDELPVGQADTRTELEEAIESTRQDLNEVTNIHENQRSVREALQPAERGLQEAIVAYIENDQTVARIRFRQARDTFEDAHETITESEDDLLTEPVVVAVQPDREPPSTTLTELPVVSEAEATALADAGIETVDDLDSSAESPWTPGAVEELVANETIEEGILTTLTLLSWWHGDETYTFETAEGVERRQQQADYGFNQSS